MEGMGELNWTAGWMDCARPTTGDEKILGHVRCGVVDGEEDVGDIGEGGKGLGEERRGERGAGRVCNESAASVHMLTSPSHRQQRRVWRRKEMRCPWLGVSSEGSSEKGAGRGNLPRIDLTPTSSGSVLQ